jgi:hypothetical protein
MVSSGFFALIRTDTFKIKVKIKDRQLHTSNEVESGDLTLRGILQ